MLSSFRDNKALFETLTCDMDWMDSFVLTAANAATEFSRRSTVQS
jgi:hypothetical protein